MREAADAYNALAPVPVTARTREQVERLFGGIPLGPPGVVPVHEWPPEAADPVTACPTCGAAWRVPGAVRRLIDGTADHRGEYLDSYRDGAL